MDRQRMGRKPEACLPAGRSRETPIPLCRRVRPRHAHFRRRALQLSVTVCPVARGTPAAQPARHVRLALAAGPSQARHPNRRRYLDQVCPDGQRRNREGSRCGWTASVFLKWLSDKDMRAQGISRSIWELAFLFGRFLAMLRRSLCPRIDHVSMSRCGSRDG
jgi:hypothetical protein